MNHRAFHILLFFAAATLLVGQEVPKVIHFTKENYASHNQNWDLDQCPDRQLVVGNSGGLLRYDGARWRTYSTPAGQAIRAVACDSTGKVFVGGFETLGYWEGDQNGSFTYHSLLGVMDGDSLGNEEIWHILPLPGHVLFQSFSTIYLYDYQQVRAIRPPGNIMFARKVNDDIIVPVINSGLFRFTGLAHFEKIPGSEVFDTMLVTGILPSGENSLLIGTQSHGVFQQVDSIFIPWQTPVNEELINMQLNQSLQLKNGNYVFGTILGGIIITSQNGQILQVINQEKGLQNNTVLSLLQDRAGQLWVGLDNGLDQIVLDSPLRFFQDKTGEIGTVYTAAVFDEKLYLGTNHGVFYKNFPSQEAFRLLNGSQGQVWDLQVYDGQLIGGHNAGTIRISGDKVNFLFAGTGVYATVRHPDQPDILLQGTYTGIVALRKNSAGEFVMHRALEDFAQPARKLLFDKQGRLWVLHARKGLFRLTLDEHGQKTVKTEVFDELHGLPSLFQLDMDRIGEEIVFKSGNQFFSYDEQQAAFVRKTSIGGVSLDGGSFQLHSGRGSDWFKIFPREVHLFRGEEQSVFHLSLVRGDEHLVALPGGGYLFCQDDGYARVPPEAILSTPAGEPVLPLVTGVVVGKKQSLLDGISGLPQPYIFGPSENWLTFQYACPQFTFQPAIRYRLRGFDEKWSPFETVYSKEFTNLPPGEYSFEIQAEQQTDITAFPFLIEPKWYQTAGAKIAYLLLFLTTVFLLMKWHDRRMTHQKRQLELEKQRELEQQLIHTKNELLQAEVINKSRILADTTMNLIRKNEMLTKIKEELEQATRRKNRDTPGKAFTKMEHLIDAHLTSEEDWQVFEANFNQLHDQFFKRLKDEYPVLTPGDLRLAAYLKMNLSSKEIAPLLNISVRGVENKRYRLRQKMQLDSEVNLTEYLMAY